MAGVQRGPPRGGQAADGTESRLQRGRQQERHPADGSVQEGSRSGENLIDCVSNKITNKAFTNLLFIKFCCVNTFHSRIQEGTHSI